MKGLLLVAIIAVAYSLDNGLALTPPMVLSFACHFIVGLDAVGAVPL